MTSTLKTAALCLILAVPVLQASVLAAQPAKPVSPAPIPAQIVAAKKVFVSNAGADEPFYDDPLFSGGSDRAYNEFYAAAKGLGRYQLVGTPADADLLFEIQFSVPRIEQKEVRGDTLLSPIPYDPQFRLVIRDPKTNALLWAFTEHAQWALLKANRDKNIR
jgi:hypothetical protein